MTASISSLSEQEKERYQALYCGLCRALGVRYGQVSRAVLTYDLTFYVMLCDSLHEPPEDAGAARCVTHPAKRMPYARSRFTDYAADLAVALAYHKCLDDWHDDRSKKARAAAALLEGAYAKAQVNAPAQCAAIEAAMAQIARIETDAQAQPDEAACAFGALLGELFAYEQGFWADGMRAFGDWVGRFIYMMDAAVDFAQDAQSGSYNPLVRLGMTPEDIRTLLEVLIGNAAAAFEKLPLEQDVHLLRSVLYEGVWQQFGKTYGEDGEGGAEGAQAGAPEREPASAVFADTTTPASGEKE